MPEADIFKGFGASGWIGMMTLWEQAGIAARNGELTPESLKEQMRRHERQPHHRLGAVRVCRRHRALHRHLRPGGDASRSGTGRRW